MKNNIENIIKALINAYSWGYDRAELNERSVTFTSDRDDIYDCITDNIRRLDLIQSVEEDTEVSNLTWQLINEETAF